MYAACTGPGSSHRGVGRSPFFTKERPLQRIYIPRRRSRVVFLFENLLAKSAHLLENSTSSYFEETITMPRQKKAPNGVLDLSFNRAYRAQCVYLNTATTTSTQLKKSLITISIDVHRPLGLCQRNPWAIGQE